MEPVIISKGILHIAGVSGSGAQTGELWSRFSQESDRRMPTDPLSVDGYEVRIYTEAGCDCHVGIPVETDIEQPDPFTVLTLPASEYAVFDVHVAQGYDSKNAEIDEWLGNNGLFRQRQLDGRDYIVEYYGEQFHGAAPDSIVELWAPVAKIA